MTDSRARFTEATAVLAMYLDSLEGLLDIGVPVTEMPGITEIGRRILTVHKRIDGEDIAQREVAAAGQPAELAVKDAAVGTSFPVGDDVATDWTAPPPVGAPIDQPPARRQSIVGLVLPIFEPGETLSVAEVVSRLESKGLSVSRTQVNNNLSTLVYNHMLQRPVKGLYHRPAVQPEGTTTEGGNGQEAEDTQESPQ